MHPRPGWTTGWRQPYCGGFATIGSRYPGPETVRHRRGCYRVGRRKKKAAFRRPSPESPIQRLSQCPAGSPSSPFWSGFPTWGKMRPGGAGRLGSRFPAPTSTAPGATVFLSAFRLMAGRTGYYTPEGRESKGRAESREGGAARRAAWGMSAKNSRDIWDARTWTRDTLVILRKTFAGRRRHGGGLSATRSRGTRV